MLRVIADYNNCIVAKPKTIRLEINTGKLALVIALRVLFKSYEI